MWSRLVRVIWYIAAALPINNQHVQRFQTSDSPNYQGIDFCDILPLALDVTYHSWEVAASF